MPKPEDKVVTEMQSGASMLQPDHWKLILRKLTAREQTPLRRVSKGFLRLIDKTDFTAADAVSFGYRELMTRSTTLIGSQSEPVNARSFNQTWQLNFRHKLKPTEVDFFTAVISGDAIAADRLLKENPDFISLSNVAGYTALHFAAGRGDVAMLDCLYAYVPVGPVNVLNVIDRAPALSKNRHLMNAKTYLGDLPINCVIRSGNCEAILWFKQKLQAYIRENAHHERAGDNRNPIRGILAVMRGQLANLPWLLVRHHQSEWLDTLVDEVDITAANQAENSLLHEAASVGNVAYLKHCLANPIYNNEFLRRRNSHGRNIFHCALSGGHLETIEWLIATDASLLDTLCANNGTALRYAVLSGNLAVVKKIFELRPALLQTPHQRQNEYIYDAIQYGNLKILAFLLRKGANLSFDSVSPLNLAIGHFKSSSNNDKNKQGSLAVIRFLINYLYQGLQQGKYTQAAVDKYLSQALDFAEAERVNGVIPLLLEAGAIPDFESYYKSKRVLSIPSMERILPSPEVEKARQDYKNKLYYSRWLRGLLWLGSLLLMGAVGLGALALITWVAMPLALNITVQVVASLAMLALSILSVMTMFKLFDDTLNLPFFSRVRLKPFAPIPIPEEAAAKAKAYYPTVAPEAVHSDPTPASQNLRVDPVQSEGAREVSLPRLTA